MRAALIGNREDTDPGIIGHVLRERGFSFVEFAREDPASYGDPAGFDLVLAMGSSWSAYWSGSPPRPPQSGRFSGVPTVQAFRSSVCASVPSSSQ